MADVSDLTAILATLQAARPRQDNDGVVAVICGRGNRRECTRHDLRLEAIPRLVSRGIQPQGRGIGAAIY
jgi:hypothetical protein